MSIHRVSAASVLHELTAFDAIIDTRSEGEYAHDRLPGAVNWPSLHDAERARVGTLHRDDAFAARKLGAVLVARNIAAHVERELATTPRGWKPLVYCWRGGNRSQALAAVLAPIGFGVRVLDGGYKAFRRAVLDDLPRQASRLQYIVLCGPTGSGKTRLLHALAASGAQVLDLEGLACHRASVLGQIPGLPQPSQKHFETRLWQALSKLDPQRPVFVEAESRKVGSVTLPTRLIETVRASPCLRLELPDAERVALLLEDYPFFVDDTEFFCSRLDALVRWRGRAQVARWKQQARAGQTRGVVQELLALHYDPSYARSTRRNFSRFEDARAIPLPSRSAAAMQRASEQILSLFSSAEDASP